MCGNKIPSCFEKALNTHFEFKLDDLNDGNFAVQYKCKKSPENNSSGWKSVEVVAQQTGANQPAWPMTADYDVLGYFPHLSNFRNGTLPTASSGQSVRENFQSMRVNNASQPELKKGLFKSVANKVRPEFLGQTTRNNPSPRRGSSTEFENSLAKQLNKILRPEVYDTQRNVKPNSAGVLIKHGPEVNNPHPENDEHVDREEVAWSLFENGKSATVSQIFTAADSGVFKARLKAMKQTIQTLAISEPDRKQDKQALKSIFIENLKTADQDTEINHQRGTRFCNYNKSIPTQEVQQKVEALEAKLRSATLSELDLNSAFNEMQYLSNLYIAQKKPVEAVAIYCRLLPLLPEITPPWRNMAT